MLISVKVLLVLGRIPRSCHQFLCTAKRCGKTFHSQNLSNSKSCLCYLFADSKNDKVINTLLSYIIDSLQNVNQQLLLPHNVTCYGSAEPLSMQMLDALSVHTKILFVPKTSFNSTD